MSSSDKKKKKRKRSRFGPPKESSNMNTAESFIESKTKQIDALLAGFDAANNPKKKAKLNFIPSSINKQSASSTNIKTPCSDANDAQSEMVKTITITPTSYKIEHHKEQNAATPPLISTNAQCSTPIPLQLRPLPSPNAKPLRSALKPSKRTSFTDFSKRSSKRRNSSSESHKVKFDDSVKKEDGVSAKFYSAPQYLIRDGSNVLRPKPRQQIENEKRLLQMLGAPEELAGRALPPGLVDQDFEEEYDPTQPNDYTSFVNARERLEEWIKIKEEQSNFAYQKAMMAAQSAEAYIESELKKERKYKKKDRKEHKKKDRDRDRSRDKDRRSRSRERDRDRDREKKKEKKSKSGLDKAAKMMAKFGWKRGDGLGKSKQGLKGCLVPVGNHNQLVSIQDPTNVLLLQNMAEKGRVDCHLKVETIEECKQFGPVLDCVVHEADRDVAKEQQVSVFVKFEYIESCMNALQRFNGRFFDGRRVIASFFPVQRFDDCDFDN